MMTLFLMALAFRGPLGQADALGIASGQMLEEWLGVFGSMTISLFD
jgi:hypothetical protein